MATKKYKRAAPSKSVPKGTLKISSKKAKVPAPKGHHWMFEGGRYYLMKGDYKPHPGASEFADFKLVDHAKAKKANRGMRVDVTSPTGMSYYENGGKAKKKRIDRPYSQFEKDKRAYDPGKGKRRMPLLLRLEGRVNAINDIVASNKSKRKEKGDRDLMNFSASLTPKRYKSGGVNAAGNYTKPGMRKRIFNRIKAGTKGGNAGQWSARKAQMLAKAYKAAGGGYKN
jgi:hypothetical protein